MTDYKTDQVHRDKIAQTLEIEIDEASELIFPRHRSRRLGSSQIGYGCSRRIWYGFRWAKEEKLGNESRPAGRLLRLFDRGHQEEIRLTRWLEKVGCKFEKPPEGKEQFEYVTCEGHAVTKLDGICILPDKFQVPDRVLVEMKTMNYTAFGQCKKNGVRRQEPKYWSQVCFSAELANLDYILFLCVNKNDDEIYLEFLQADRELGKMLVDKAMSIITAKEAPLRIANSPTNFACKFCPYVDICFNDEPVEVNCRSCQHCSACAEGKFACTNPMFDFGQLKYGIIPDEAIASGCQQHKGID